MQVLFAYVNLLKTISMKLTPGIVGLFFHVDGEEASFPLYTGAVKFIAHRCCWHLHCAQQSSAFCMQLDCADCVALLLLLASRPQTNALLSYRSNFLKHRLLDNAIPTSS